MGILAAAALCVRLPALEARPMHCDEAVQAVKAGHLLETGQYRYDPYEYHGPTLNYFTLPALWLGGETTLADSTEADYRIVPVVFGAGLVLLLLLVADGLGRGAAVIAGVLTAVSPAMVFYSRYYIHETLLVFFSFAAIGCGWRYLRSGALGWAIAAGAAVGLMHATKETWVLAAAAMVAGAAACFAWTRLLRWVAERGSSATAAPTSEPLGRQSHPSLGRQLHCRPRAVLAAMAAACVVAVVFYTSFFTHWRGPLDSILTYATYVDRGGGGEHDHPWDFYFRLLVARVPARGFFWPDAVIPALAAVGFVAALLPASKTHLLPRFVAFYTLALTLVYTLLPYKTPWCMLGFLHGMILLAGFGAWTAVRWLWGIRPPRLAGQAGDLPAGRQVGNLPYQRRRLRWAAACLLTAAALVLLAAGVAHLGWQCYAINFRYPADGQNPYVYAHATSDTVRLGEQVENLAGLTDEGCDATVHVVTPDNYWPLPWYLRKFPRTGYWNDAAAWWEETQGRPQADILILGPGLPEDIQTELMQEQHYFPQGMRGLRPGVFVDVYISLDLRKRQLAAAGLAGR